MATHPAIIVPGIKKPLTVKQVPTVAPKKNEIQVRSEWVPSAPLDVFQVDAGLMAQFPLRLGDSVAGTVVAVGSDVLRLEVGDRVFGFVFHNENEKGHQIYVTAAEHLFGKVPDGIPLSAATTLSTNFCTAFLLLSENLHIDLPWPRPNEFVPKDQDAPILIWGAGSSVGGYAVQILKHWGYRNVLATASLKHKKHLEELGATHIFDYRSADVVSSIAESLKSGTSPQPIRVFDSIDSKYGSLQPISKIATQSGSRVAAVLPVVISAPSSLEGLKLSADPSKEADWVQGVEVHAIVSYTYETNDFLRENLMPEILPTLLAQGAIQPSKQRIIEARTLLERATAALEIMRSGSVSGERLVWKVWTAEEFPEYA